MEAESELPEIPIQLEAVWGSSNVAATGYDEDSSVMVVQYLNGAQYRWEGIPLEEYQALRAAPSAGKYLRQIEARYGKGVPF